MVPWRTEKNMNSITFSSEALLRINNNSYCDLQTANQIHETPLFVYKVAQGLSDNKTVFILYCWANTRYQFFGYCEFNYKSICSDHKIVYFHIKHTNFWLYGRQHFSRAQYSSWVDVGTQTHIFDFRATIPRELISRQTHTFLVLWQSTTWE